MFCEKLPLNSCIFCLEALHSVSDCLSKGLNVSTRELNEILASLLSIRTLLLTSRDSARFLPFTKLVWILEGWKWILICVMSFFPSNSKICYKTRTLLWLVEKTKYKITHSESLLISFGKKYEDNFLHCSFLKRHIQCGKIFQIYILYNKISSN